MFGNSDTNFVFKPGKLTTILDGQAGSSGKGKIGSFVTEHADNWQFCCNTFMPQAGHWVVLDDGRKFFYQTFNSCAYNHDKYEKMYIGPGATIELEAFWRELEENKIPWKKIGISPVASILQKIDGGYERGTHDFNGDTLALVNNKVHYGIELVSGIPFTGDHHKISAKIKHSNILPESIVVIAHGIGEPKAFMLNDHGVAEALEAGIAIKEHELVFSCSMGDSIEITFDSPPPADYKFTLDYEIEKEVSNVVGGYLAKTGTTAHGCGANRARRVLRRPEAKYARDIPELKDFICDVPLEIIHRLGKGQAGLLEIAQGFQLSYLLPQFFPHTTSRNCSVAAGLDDMMIPPFYAGNVIINLRTYPIRINNRKFIDKASGKHLTWAEVQAMQTAHQGQESDLPYQVIEGSSGPGYPDQAEITWEELTKRSQSPTPIMEMTSVTKLPRRVFTFSMQNLREACLHNLAGGDVFLSINFMNYVDHKSTGRRGSLLDYRDLPRQLSHWIDENIDSVPYRQMIKFLGTGAATDDTVLIKGG